MDQPTANKQPPHLAKPKAQPVPGRFRFPRVLRRWWWLALVLMITIVGVGYKVSDWLKIRGPLYESKSLLEVKPIPGFDPAVTATAPTTLTSSSSGTSTLVNSPFISTQEEIIKAPVTLELAMKQNDLLNRMGGNQTEVLKRMEKSLRVTPRYGTDLIQVSFRDEDPQVARDALTAIYESYVGRRSELEMQVRDNKLQTLRSEIKNQESKVKVLKDKLVLMSEKYGMHWDGSAQSSTMKTNKNDARKLAQKDLYVAEREKEELDLQIKKLENLDGEELIRRASKLEEVGFPERYQEYIEAQENLELLRATGIAPKHPEFQQKSKAVEGLQSALLKRASNTKVALQLRLDMLEKRIEKIKKISGNGSNDVRVIRDFNSVIREHQSAQSILEGVSADYEIAKNKFNSPTISHIVHEEPRLASRTVTKGRNFFTTILTISAAVCSIFVALAAIYLAEVIFPLREKA